MKLNQVIALKTGAKERAHTAITALHRIVGHVPNFSGLVRTYSPVKDGDPLPSENQIVQQSAETILNDAISIWTDIQNITLTQEVANCSAKADVIVDGKKVLEAVPVSFLVQFEKTLNDVHTFVANFPTLSPDDEWKWNADQLLWVGNTVTSARTTKLNEFVVVPNSGVPDHGVPDVVKEVTKDVVTGYWNTQKLSGALSPKQKKDLLARIENVRRAVKIAREEANAVEAKMQTVFGDFFTNLLKPI